MGRREAEHLMEPSFENETRVTLGGLFSRTSRVIEGLLSRRHHSANGSPHPEPPVDAEEPPVDAKASERSWTPFDEQRRSSDLRRADIVFGPDMFDPRTDNGDRPLSRALEEGRSEANPEDLSKTVGEVLGADVSSAEVGRVTLENAGSIDLGETSGSGRDRPTD